MRTNTQLYMFLFTLFNSIQNVSYATINHCPENSVCTEKSMGLYQKYTHGLNQLKNSNNIEKLAVPNYGYRKRSDILESELYWKDCPGNSSVKVMFFSDNLLLPKMIHKPFYKITNDMIEENIKPYYLPFTESPLFIFNDRIYFIKQIQSNYFYASVGNQGSFLITKNIPFNVKKKYLELKKRFKRSISKCKAPANLDMAKSSLPFPESEFTPDCMFVANLNKNKFEKYFTLKRQCLRN